MQFTVYPYGVRAKYRTSLEIRSSDQKIQIYKYLLPYISSQGIIATVHITINTFKMSIYISGLSGKIVMTKSNITFIKKNSFIKLGNHQNTLNEYNGRLFEDLFEDIGTTTVNKKMESQCVFFKGVLANDQFLN